MELYKKSFESERLQHILDCFVELTEIRAAYFDLSKESVLGKHKDMCSFCKAIREYSTFDAECRSSDSAAFEYAAKTGQTYLYTCPMGLWEAVVPISIHTHPAGYLMLGQVKGSNEAENWKKIESMLRSIKVSDEKIGEINTLYKGMPVFVEHKIEAAAKMLEIMAQHIISTKMIHIFDSEIVEKAKHYLEEHIQEQISVKHLAQLLNMSQSSLCNIFKKDTGKTITGYHEQLRMNNAAELLLMTPLTIKEISSRLGYEDQNYFSRAFKKVWKCSPLQYREKFKKSC